MQFSSAGWQAAVVTCVLLVTATGVTADEPVGKLKVVIAAGPGQQPLGEFQKFLKARHQVECRWLRMEKAKREQGNESYAPTPAEGLPSLAWCDVILSNLYRTWAPPEQLTELRRQFRSKPVVGLRKAHHGFQNWPEADRDVFGVRYRGHYFGKNVTLRIVERRANDPLLENVEPKMPAGGLYKHIDLQPDVDVLMIGGPENSPPHPQMWRRIHAKTGQRVIYTRYDPDDLSNASVRDMIVRSLFWAANRNE